MPLQAGTRVLVRASLNVPMKEGRILNDMRLRRALPTLRRLAAAGARVVVVGHLGRGGTASLRPVHAWFEKELPLLWCQEAAGAAATHAVASLADGQVLLLENIRKHKGEVRNDASLARFLASLADVFVFDAFPVAHRAHASVVGVSALLPTYFGDAFIDEYTALSRAAAAVSPSLFILGGAKADTKLPLIERAARTYDTVFLGGAVANDFFSARGYCVGRSLVSQTARPSQHLLEAKNIMLPVDVQVASDDGVRVAAPEDIAAHETIKDIGPCTMGMLERAIGEAQTILWNGPLGAYEQGFVHSTKQCAQAIADSDAQSVVGGGDTVAAIATLSIQKRLSFLSSAGGAMLYFLTYGTVPVLDVAGDAVASS